MSIRRAVITDLEHILHLTEIFNEKYFDVELNPDKAEDAIVQLILHGIVFVSDNGFIGGVIAPDIFRDWVYLQELGWFATDSSGYKLLNAFIKDAREQGVDEIRMCTLETSDPIAEKILLRKGFSPIERSFRLQL